MNYFEISILSEYWYRSSLDYLGNDIITFSSSGDIMKVLLEQGCVVAHIKDPSLFTFVKFYKRLRDQQIPIFITSDSLLHLYHVQFDETLLEIEGREFYGDLLAFTQSMLSESKTKYQNNSGDLKEASGRNEAFFSVALRLLDPNSSISVSSYIQQEVNDTLSLITKHEGFASDPIFKYREDYSQYVPRGHYTRSETLEKYFRAMMWYGRMAFLLKGGDNPGIFEFNDAFISKEDARIQTLQAALIASIMPEVKIADRSLFEIWWRIYLVTSFYVGIADDLTPHEYLESMKKAFDGKPIDMEALANNEEVFFDFKAQLALLPSPEIYGGTGEATVTTHIPLTLLTPDLLDDYLDKTMGMRFIGQRYVPDSYIMGQLVFPSVNLLKRETPCFTTSPTPLIYGNGYVRGFPMGLDVMAVFGSERAEKFLAAFGDTDYEGYDEQFNKLKGEFEELGEDEWNKNLYWSWLYCLKSLLERPGQGYPTFMQTDAWQDKQLNTALASWTELRHDTILYSKQSYTGGVVSAPPRVVGYVEPLPEFYARLLSLTRMTNQGLSLLNCLDNNAQKRLANLETILQRLLDLSMKELKNEPLSDEDYDFIDDFGAQLQKVILNIPSKSMDHYLVADVHTDINTYQALEEGIGHLDILLAAYKVPDGRIIIGAGPVFSYYEFKQPMANRLTDDAWRQLLYSSNCPERPPWIYSFCLDKDNKDQRAILPYSLSLKGDEPSGSQSSLYIPYPFFSFDYLQHLYPFSFLYLYPFNYSYANVQYPYFNFQPDFWNSNHFQSRNSSRFSGGESLFDIYPCFYFNYPLLNEPWHLPFISDIYPPFDADDNF